MQIEARPDHLINYYRQRLIDVEHSLAIHASVIEQLRAENAVLKSKLAQSEPADADR